MKTYYQILGVLDDADEVVIRAAYKALAQRYHPDKWSGDKAEASKRMAEINEAYDVLSNAAKRKAYDDSREKSGYQSEESDSVEDELIRDIERDWCEVVEYLPDLKQLGYMLSQLSKQLEFAFKATLLETKDFKHRVSIAERMEQNFLSRYFGSDKYVQSFAKELILNGHRKEAKDLNRAVDLLGSNIDPQVIISKIRGDMFEKSGKARAINYAKSILNKFNHTHATAMISDLGGTIRDAGIFTSDVEVKYGDLNFKRMTDTDFQNFAQGIAQNLVGPRSN